MIVTPVSRTPSVEFKRTPNSDKSKGTSRSPSPEFVELYNSKGQIDTYFLNVDRDIGEA